MTKGIRAFYVLHIYRSVYSQEWQGLGGLSSSRGEWICHGNGSQRAPCFLLFLSYLSTPASDLSELEGVSYHLKI